MRLRKVRLKNGYKRFHDLTIDLGDAPARIVALVGPNGCGKSSVLDGLLFHARSHRQVGGGSNRNHRYHSMDETSPRNWDDIEVEFTDGNYVSIFNRREVEGKGGTIFSFRSPYRYNNVLKVNETRATQGIKENNYGAGDAASLDAKMEENYRRLYVAYNAYLEEYDVKPSEAKQKIIGDLNASIGRCLNLEIVSIGSIEANRGTIYFKKIGHPNEFEFDVLSSGEKEVVDLLLDLYLRKADYDETVFLLDEPELHINTSIQRELLREIDRLVGPKCQIWLTTHSIGFLRVLQNEMQGDCQIVLFNNIGDLAAKSCTLRPIKSSPAVWREILSIALDDLATLISPQTLIYCEGRADPGQGGMEKGLDAKVLNNVFSETNPEALFISSGGNTELDQRSAIAIAILSKAIPSVEVLVLKDRDMASGENTDENDRQVYLKNNPPSHRVLKRWEIENYLYDKEVLRAYCTANKLTFDEAAYDAFVTDVTNQNLKDGTGRIKNFCGVKGSITADTFKIALSDYLTNGMAVFAELSGCIFSRV